MDLCIEMQVAEVEGERSDCPESDHEEGQKLGLRIRGCLLRF